ncbi:MAG: diguanylate cyclase [Peptostreptococcaceae bacterium]|nr:diguanylate cyclase [Peptostreptococcaceae bacterium]
MNERKRMTCENDKKCTLHILSLEDSPMDADLIKEYLLENFGSEIQINTVANEEDFISAISKDKFDLILSDFRLPGFDGFQALEHAKSMCSFTPFICVSGVIIGEVAASELLKQGATDYVSKENLGRLKQSIERALKELKETEEKEKRAAELIIVNKELAIKNKELALKNKELAIKNKELALKNKEISYISYHDFLTGLYNRTYFEEAKLRLDTPRQLPISIIMGDINGLKLINDGFGHSKGDGVLIEVAKILKNCCRKEDIISKIGGDEFGILLPKTDSQSAQQICNRIYDTCKGFVLNGSSIYPSISLGHATKNIETEMMDGIFMAAEEAMYRHKLLESRSAHSSILASIKAIMFEKSQETEEHAARMVQLSKSIGLAMSLSEDQLNELELSATLHDIGKMGVDSKILSKLGKLSDEEWVEMRKHPEVGFRIAQATSELIPIADYILCHHERWDGKGYPQGLIGEQIPLLSRIVAIADSFDAMTNDRTYRSAMTKGEAIEEIRRNSGTQFDPDISQLFLNIISEELTIDKLKEAEVEY